MAGCGRRKGFTASAAISAQLTFTSPFEVHLERYVASQRERVSTELLYEIRVKDGGSKDGLRISHLVDVGNVGRRPEHVSASTGSQTRN